uniref:Uncharacterized protein n=1 Tax=Fagus sylvatica TaxID=28930 RepID=A0A2N9GJN9_FAGSY
MAGETSSGTTKEAQTQSISIQPSTLEAKFNTVNEAEENAKNQSTTPKIQKVIFLLRDQKDFEKYYEPRVVSLGPIHHGKEKYQLGEKYKLVLTSKFVKGSGKDIKDLYKKIEENINDLRDCFEEEVTKKYDDEKLAWLLFVDGCAILQYIYCATKNMFKELNIKTDSVTFGHQDLFLLENQLPYRLLKWLMGASKMKNELKESIKTYIANHDMIPEDQKSRRCFCFGYLSLPPITVDDSTRPKFLNLIAYEMCLDFENNFEITSYISFLDSLIDEAKDVKELRKARVLYNFLGSDEEVAQLFNEIGTDLVPNPETYNDVKHQIQEYYDNKCMTWIAQVIHDHFSSPWTILAFCGVLFGLGLTAAQTWYAVNSSRPGPCDHLCKNLTQKLHMLKLKFY